MKKLNKDRFGNPKTTPGVFKRQGIISWLLCYMRVILWLFVAWLSAMVQVIHCKEWSFRVTSGPE